MSTQVRDRRKKTFKMKEGREVEQSSTGTDGNVGKQEETPTLNIRRSSRKPKPRKYDDDDDDDYVSTGQETTEKASESGDVDASIKSDEPEMAESSGILPGSGVKRETRKTYQNYLETLGYHTDFSKISSPEPVKQSVKGKVGSEQSNIAKHSKSEEKIITKQLFPTNLISDPSTRIRTSSRTPKPKKTFALLEDDSTTHTKDSDSVIPQNVVGVMSPETGIKSPKIGKGKTASSENFSQSEKPFKGRTRATSSVVHDSSSTMPLSKQDVDQAEVLFDPEDSGQLRTSARVRVPKRKFSLIEALPSIETKRQKLMSPEYSADVEVCGDKELQDKVEESNNENLQTQSSLVIKRSGRKKQKRNIRKGDPIGSCMPTDKEKVEHLSKKIDKSHIDLETEKKSESRRVKQRMEKEPIVPKLKISKDSAVVKDSKKTKKNKDKEDEDQTYNSRKHLKRKRGNSDLEKSASEKEEKEVKNDGKEHIVLKLTIPHGSPKTDENEKGHEKHHKHHHHHKHKKEKKESESDTKKNKSDGEDVVPESKETSDKDLKVMETVIKGKKKKKKKEETSELLSSDNSAVPHVKLVIKKSPIKQKDEKNASKSDALKINKPSSQGSDDQNIRSDKPKSKVKSSKKEDKPTPKSPKKKIKKDVKVSAYSLFTKSRRKNLLEKEPDLDFASTSRRLADMWRELSLEDKEYWRLKAQAIRKANNLKQKAGLKGYKGNNSSRKGCQDSDSASHSKESDVTFSSGTDAVDMAAYLKLLGESLCSIGMCLKRQDQMEVHGSLSVLLDTALCSIVPLFCLTSQLPELAGCSPETQAQILDNLAYIIPGL